MIRLKELREENNMNMKEAALFLKKKYMTYVNHEKGKREPNSEDLKAYATAYGVSIDYLTGRTNIKNPPREVTGDNDDLIISEKDKRFLDWFHSLPQEKRKAILISQDAPEDLF